jgi:hypothetical protein
MLKEWDLVVDSSEQVRERPRDYKEQKRVPIERRKILCEKIS